MKNKLNAILFGTLILAFVLIANASAQLYPICDNDLYSLTYSPNDLVSGQTFNATLTDIWGLIIGQPAWLNYSTLTGLSSNPQSIVDVGGFGQAKWLLNSTSSFSGNLTATIFNGTNNCTLVKSINITNSGLVGIPNIVVSINDWTLINASKNPSTYRINYSNPGTGNAFNVSTLFTLPGFSSQSSAITVASGATNVPISAGIITSALCGTQNLSMHTRYQNMLGEWYNLNNYDSFNVSGSDLTITNVYLEKTTYYNDQTVNSVVTVRNVNRTLNGGFPADAMGVIVRFEGVQCNGPNNLGIGQTANFTCGYHLDESIHSTQTITYTLTVDSPNDCSNWNGSLKSYDVDLTIRPTSTSGGGGGSGGGSTGGGTGYVSVCGNKICEVGENSASCPSDCGAVNPINQGQETGQGQDYLIIYSDDGKASVFATSGTKIFMDKAPIINPKSWIIIKPSNVTTQLPYGIVLIRQYEFIPNGLEFIPEATISFNYDNSELKNGAYIMYYDNEDNKWVFVDSSTDRNNNLVSTKVSHFSTYALVTKQQLPLTGFALLDSSIIFLKENIFVNALIVLGIVMLIFVLILLSRSGKK